MLVMEGNNVSLPCSADGNPSGSKITYQWKRGNKEVAVSNLTGNLTIKGATLADSGEYTCIPFNRHGTESTAIVVLTVKPKEPLRTFRLEFPFSFMIIYVFIYLLISACGYGVLSYGDCE